MDSCALLPQIQRIAEEAGKAILAVYRRQAPPSTRNKPDNTPVTEADLNAHRLIQASLERLTPDIPVLSEESPPLPWAQRRHWQRYWLVDPLDGTKEFIQGNDEFTVNIALIEQHRATLGVVHVPASGTSYLGTLRLGAFKVDVGGRRKRLHVRPAHPFKPLTLVTSRSHSTPGQEALIQAVRAHQPLTLTPVGSSLKFCLIAEGLADLSLRLGPTSEWDTAAGQAVLEAAGGQVVDLDFSPVAYNRKASLTNPDFYALGDPEFDWRELLEKAHLNDTGGTPP